MTTPQKPDDTLDEILDMTPEDSPLGDSDDMEDLTPEDSQGDETGETVDTVARYMPEDEPLETMTPRSSSTSGGREAWSTARRAPAPTMEETGDQDRGKKRLKTIVLTLLALVALAYVGHKVLGSSLGSRALGLFGGNTATQSTPPNSQGTTAPLPTQVQIGNQKVTTAVGPLILLNPGVVRQGTDVSVTGSGFDPGSVVDVSITRQGSSSALASILVKTDKTGGFYGVSMSVPTSLSAGSFNVVGHERNSSHTAQAFGSIAGGAPQVKLGLQVGQPGTPVTVSLNGFAPMETIKVYWNTLSGQPLTTFQADGGGGVGQGHLQVPYGAVGNNTFLFVGAKSLSLVAANFLMLNLYPTVKLSSYALKADNLLSFTGKGFGPGEPVLVYLNSTQGQPLAVVSADGSGSFKNAPGFVIPYLLKGKQTLIFMGEQSRAPDTVTFTVLPYSPLVEPSTYGGLPGTAISFYVSGFAPSEVVHVYAGHTKSTLGNMVGCFETDGKGKAVNVGSYVIPGSAQGTLGFALVGEKSGGVGTASVNVSAPPESVQTPPQAPFTCPLDQPAQPAQSGKPSPGSPAGATPTGAQGSVGLPSHQITAESSVVSPVTPLVADADFAEAVSVRAGLFMYGDLGDLGLASIVVGAGLMWVIAAVVLTCILIRRSYRLEIASRPYRRNGEPRGQLGRERENRDQALVRSSFLSHRASSLASVRCIQSKKFGGRRHSNDARSHGRSRSARPHER